MTEPVEIPLEIEFLMLAVGETAASVCGSDFLINVSPVVDKGGVLIGIGSAFNPKVGKLAFVKALPDLEIRRLAIEMCYQIYGELDALEDQKPHLVVPEKKLIIPS